MALSHGRRIAVAMTRLIGLAIVIGAGAGFIGAQLLPPGDAMVRALLAVLPFLVGAMLWIMSGSGVMAAASWSAPAAVLLVGARLVLSPPVVVLVEVISLGWLIAMVVWVPAARWWYRQVLRRDPSTNPLES